MNTASVAAPPLRTLWRVLQDAGESDMITTMRLYPAKESFLEFAKRLPSGELEKRSVGNYDDVQVVYQNAWWGEWLVQTMAREIYNRQLSIPVRDNAAGVCLIAASQTFDSAIILYLRPEPWTDLSACMLIRSALEATGCAAFIARGTSDEVERFDKHVPRRIEPRESVSSLQPLLERARPGAPLAYGQVYNWLCERAHLRSDAIEPYMQYPEAPRSEETYAAMAFVGWAIAVVTEHVTGRPALANWPHMPPKLPWE